MKGLILKFLLLTLLSVGFFSCEQNNKVTVGFLMESFSADRWVLDRKFFEEKVKALDANLITKISDGSDANQYTLAVELLDAGIDVLVVVASNVNTAAAIVREAHQRGVKVVAYDRLIRNSDLDYFVGFDMQQIGQLQAKYAIEKKPKGNYILLEGDKADINAVDLETGQMKELSSKVNNGDINIIYRVFVDNWSTTEAIYEIEKVIKLSDKQIDAIISANDGNALGARISLEKHGLADNVLITGLDADKTACRRIMDGRQTMTVYTPIIELAETSAELAIKIAKNEKLDYTFSSRNNGRIEVLSIILNSIALDKTNIDRVFEDGLHKREDI